MLAIELMLLVLKHNMWTNVGHTTRVASVSNNMWTNVCHRARAASVYEQNMDDSWP